MRIVGIDPGASGALATIHVDLVDGDRVDLCDTPTLKVKSGKNLKNVINVAMCAAILKTIRPDHVFIEKVWAMPGKSGEGEDRQSMGATSAFNFGMGFGMWLGILAALNIPYEQVAPSVWKRTMMGSMEKEKDASRARAMQLYPQTTKDLNLKKHHGRADALLIAAFGRKERYYP